MPALLTVLVCILLNGALAALEAAFIAASRADVQARAAESDRRVQRFLRLRETPERTLSAIQVGITLVGIVSGAVGGAAAQDSVSPYFQARLALSATSATILAIVAVAIPLMIVTVVVGELVPKTLALRNPGHLALVGERWLRLLELIFLPVVTFLAWTTRTLVARIPRAQPVAGKPGTDGGDGRRHYALNLPDLEGRRARDAMVPWAQTVTAGITASPRALVDLALSSGHTRLPIVRDGEVVGLLHTKELLTFLAAGEQDWRALVRPAVTVGPDDSLLGILRLLQMRHSRLGIVVAPNHAPLGVIAIEDILEEVLGDLYDEDDDGAVAQILAARGRVRGAGMSRDRRDAPAAPPGPADHPRIR
jgi:putative hemolysin